MDVIIGESLSELEPNYCRARFELLTVDLTTANWSYITFTKQKPPRAAQETIEILIVSVPFPVVRERS
jgi:hypothetical protein